MCLRQDDVGSGKNVRTNDYYNQGLSEQAYYTHNKCLQNPSMVYPADKFGTLGTSPPIVYKITRADPNGNGGKAYTQQSKILFHHFIQNVSNFIYNKG